MKKNIITIGRQFGSGGQETGQLLAKELGIQYYDKELLKLAAQESGLRQELFEKADEKTSNSLLQAFAMGFSLNGAIYQPYDYFTDATLFQLQSDVIRKIAEEGSCVIVGRCADYILKEHADCTHIFIHANPQERIERLRAVQTDLSEKEAMELLKKTDKNRAAYYNYYTDKTWGASASYHLSINSSLVGIPGCVALIKAFIEKREQLRNEI